MAVGRTGGRHLAPLVFLTICGPAAGDPVPRFTQPVACQLGETCHIQQYPDRDPTEAVLDHRCGTLTSDGHKGTDFAVPSLAAMQEGVAVLAAALGRVSGLRDGMPDIDASTPAAPNLSGRECGNGIMVQHEGGWETQYCHLRQGSLQVVMGQEVDAGTQLGLVGMSGLATFPHLHFAVRRDGAVVDPSLPDMSAPCRDTESDSLWDEPIAYRPAGLIAVGLLNRVPDYEAVKTGLPANGLPPGDPDALVLWGYVFGGQTGDVLEFDLTGPQGGIGSGRFELEKDQPLLYRAWGRRAPDGGFAPGGHTGEIRHLRGDQVLDRRQITFTLP